MFDSKKVKDLQQELATLKGRMEKQREEKANQRTKDLDQIESLQGEIENLEGMEKRLKADIVDLSATKKREEDLIKHNTKIVLEKSEIELAKSTAVIQAKADKKVADVKDEYRDKIEKQLDTRGTEMKEMYTDVLARLTNVAGTLQQPASSKPAPAKDS